MGTLGTPVEIEHIDLSENQISDVPELEFLTKLKDLNLSKNPTTHVQSVTLYMSGRCKLESNKITHIAKECFNTWELYDCVTRMIEIEDGVYPPTLVQPPVEVLHRGWGAVLEYFNHRLVSCCRHR